MIEHVKARIGADGGGRRWWTLVAACLGVFMVLIDVTIVNVALPTLQRDLHAKFEELQWVVNAYAVPLAVVLVTAGRLSDLYGRRRIFVGGIAVFSAGSAIAGLSGLFHFGGIPQIDVLLAARALQGVGGAVLVPVSLAIVSQAFEGHDKGTAIGIRGAMTGLGLASGPIIGGLLIVNLGWPTIFFINVPIGVFAILLGYVAIDESRDESARQAVDIWGTATLSCAVFFLVWGLIRLDGMPGGGIIGMGWPFAAAAAAFAAFFIAERREQAPMVDLSLFKNRSYAGAAATVFLLSAMLVGFIFFLTLYLQNALGFNALQTGVRLLPMTVLAGFSAPVAGRFISRSAGLAQAPPQVKRLPDFPQISRESRSAWIGSFIATMQVAAIFGAAGAGVALVTIRKGDLRE